MEISQKYIAVMMILLIASSAAGFIVAPIMSGFLYKCKFWKKKVRQQASDGSATPITAELNKNEINTPRAGGLLIWVVPLALAGVLWVLAQWMPQSGFASLNFVTRSQTWLPLFTLGVAGIIGFIDDWLVVRGAGKYIGGGLSFGLRVALVVLIGLIGALWFYFKLDWSTIAIPFGGALDLGIWFIPLFIIVMLSVFSSGVVDGVDGLSAGVFTTIFISLGALAAFRGQYQLAGFCFVIVGVLGAYAWFNIPPARFYMGETGILALSTTVTVVAFMTQSVILLPIIGIVLVMESGSVIIQLLSKKFRNGKKVFLAAPVHHHFQALGWPSPKVTMRFWLISGFGGLVGVAIAALSGVL